LCNTKGNNDHLSITQPHIIKGIYKEYLEVSGSDLIGTNTFSYTTIAMADYEMEEYVYELNYAGAHLAREACDDGALRNNSTYAATSAVCGCDEHASLPPAMGAWLCRTDESQQRRCNTNNPLRRHLTRQVPLTNTLGRDGIRMAKEPHDRP
jgi:methionine synthase I (cobalamin-dependent)